MKKRIFSMLLACVMLLSAVPALFLVAGAAEGKVVFTSSFWEEAQAGKITYDQAKETVTYGGNWQAAILGTGSYEPIILNRMNPLKNEQDTGLWAVTKLANKGMNSNGWSQWGWGSFPGSGLLNLETYTIGLSNAQGISLYMYTVTEQGGFDVSIEIEKFAAPANENKEFFMCVMVNEKMVWPTCGGTYEYNTSGTASAIFEGDENWYKVTVDTTQEMLNEALSTLTTRVKTGDRIEVCYRLAPYTKYERPEVTAMPKIKGVAAVGLPKQQYLAVCDYRDVLSVTKIEGGEVVLPAYTGTELFRGWDINGDGVVDGRAGETLDVSRYDTNLICAVAVTAGSSKWLSHIPALDSECMPIFTGSWQTGVYDIAAGTFSPFSAEADINGIIPAGASTWSKKGGGFYTTTGKFAYSGCAAGEGYMGEINYTAEQSGNILFDLEQLILRREGAKVTDYISFNFAVYVNGEKVWPVEGDMFNISSPNVIADKSYDYDALADIRAGGFPISLDVQKGDVISLRTQQGNATSTMAYIHPTVTYVVSSEKPVAVSADVTIGTDLGLNFYVEVVAGREGAVAGLEYWTSEPSAEMLKNGGTKLEGTYQQASGLYKFTYGGLTAKEMSKLVYVRPYSYVGEDVIYGEVIPFSIQMYAEKAFGRSGKLDKLLVAMLTYGANAQSAFGYNMTNLPNANIPELLLLDIFNGELNNVYAQGEGENPITGVSLLLNNQLGFKFTIRNIEGAEKYVLEFADNPEFTDAVKVDMVSTQEGEEQKASVFLNFAELDKTYYARVTVDDVAGAMLTYSMESYVCRIGNTNCTDSMYYTLMSLAQFSRAIEEYLA